MTTTTRVTAAGTTDATAGTTTPAPAAGTTTERSRRSGLSVRVRITAAVALLVALGLTVVGLIVYGVESQRLDDDVSASIDQEFAELKALQANGVNPDTGQPFNGIGGLLETFLTNNVPDDCEILLSWLGDPGLFLEGDAVRAVGNPKRLLQDPEFVTAVESVVSDGGTTTFSTAQEGELLISTQPVADSNRTGALVVITYLDQERAGLHDTMQTYLIVALLTLLLVTGLAGWQSGRLLAPLRTLRTTADEIGETDLSQRIPETGNDDITALTRTVNGMLDRLEAAFVGQRQFLDDAGHELKTPLTVLRGHLELLDTGNEQEVAETRALLLDEVDRMARLVGDLILLAKSNRPDFLHLRRADPSHLVSSVQAKARGLGDREWTIDHSTHHITSMDEQRLTQALLQLADNAVKHTRDGDEIGFGSAYDGDSLRLWVRDTGPGVSPADREVIFERFGRSSVPDHDEGFGLGLSIVAAIARAHGGEVTVEDAEPAGVRFVMTLPTSGPLTPADDS
jgi:signal transduction histidine kinase